MLIALICGLSASAQVSDFRIASWRWGAQAAVQHNTVGMGWQQLHGTDANFHSAPGSIDYVDGTGTNLYAGIFGEYLSSSWWGIQFRISYDNRNTFITDNTRNPMPSFDSKMSYITFEPLFRMDQHAIPNLSMYVGPLVALNTQASYIYNANPDGTVVTELAAVNEAETNVANLNSLTYGVEGGFGYDITLASTNNTAVLITPFVDCSWLIAQKKTVNEPSQNAIADVWSTVSYRFGLRLSMEYSMLEKSLVSNGVITPMSRTVPPEFKRVVVVLPAMQSVVTKNVQGYFPIHPYVFFEKGSTEIPSRYSQLSRAAATNFKESDLQNFMKGDMTVQETNVGQLMTSYYNVMNLYADRMRQNPDVQLTLRGSDPDRVNGEAYATKVKNYLVNNFGIDANRITIVVEDPIKPSGTSYSDPAFANLLDDENRRVVFVFTDNPNMLNSIKYTIRDESSIDNDMMFSVSNSVPYDSWDVTITGEGRSMYFGPYSYSNERINPAQIMRFLDSGTYNAKVSIHEKTGHLTEENIPFTLTKERQVRNASRYLMLFDYDKSDAISRYENRINTEIAPELVPGNRVIVHGHTDIIGNSAANLQLSQDRADQAKGIIDAQLARDNKKVSVQAIGVGQQEVQYTFDNQHPEGRMYNRNVFVEVIQ